MGLKGKLSKTRKSRVVFGPPARVAIPQNKGVAAPPKFSSSVNGCVAPRGVLAEWFNLRAMETSRAGTKSAIHVRASTRRTSVARTRVAVAEKIEHSAEN
jgi:hypothetical protein